MENLYNGHLRETITVSIEGVHPPAASNFTRGCQSEEKRGGKELKYFVSDLFFVLEYLRFKSPNVSVSVLKILYAWQNIHE